MYKWMVLWLCVMELGVGAQQLKLVSTQKLDMQPLGFRENKGQIVDQDYQPNSSVLYLCTMGNHKLQLRADGFSIEEVRLISGPKRNNSNTKGIFSESTGNIAGAMDTSSYYYSSNRVDYYFEDASPYLQIVPLYPSDDFENYYTVGTDSVWGVKGVRRYQEIQYVNVWENVNIVFAVSDSGIKYSFVGNIDSSNHTFIYKNAKTTGRISPAKLPVWLWGTYYGGSGTEPFSIIFKYSNAISFENDGNLCLASHSSSAAAIASAGAWQTVYRGSVDGIIAKFNRITGYRMWGTYYGGTNYDELTDLAADSLNGLYVCGATTSNNFIATTGSHQPFIPPPPPVFLQAGLLAKFTADSGYRVWGTYYGGVNTRLQSVAVVDSSTIVIAGSAVGTAPNIASAGAYQPTNAGGLDGILLLFNSHTGIRLWGTWYGGTGIDFFYSVEADKFGNLFAAGPTNSATNIATAGTHRDFYLPPSDNSMLIKFDKTGNRLWGTYYGAGGPVPFFNGIMDFNSVKVSPNNVVYMCGWGGGGHPTMVTPGSFQPVYGGGYNDGFVARFDNSSGQLVWGSYFGGTSSDGPDGGGITVNKLEQVYVALSNGSLFGGSPGLSTPNALFTDTRTGVMARIDGISAKMVWSTYFGANAAISPIVQYMLPYYIGVYNCGDICMLGSGNFVTGLTTPGCYQPVYGGGGSDIFLARFLDPPVAAPELVGGLRTHGVDCQGFSVSWRALYTDSVTWLDRYRSELSTSPDFVSLVRYDTLGAEDTMLRYNNLLPGVVYYWRVRAENGCAPGLWSATQTVQTLFLPQQPFAPENVTVCSGSSTVITAIPYGGSSAVWYDSSSGGKMIGFGNSLNVSALYRDTVVWVGAVQGGCESVSRRRVIVRVSDRPAVMASDTFISCGGQAVLLTVDSSSTEKLVYQWFAGTDTFRPVYSGSSYRAVPANDSVYYWVRAVKGECAGNLKKISVFRIDAHGIEALPVLNVCAGDSLVYRLPVQPNAGVLWYGSGDSSDSTILFTGNELVIDSVISDRVYWVAAVFRGCTSARRAVSIQVNALPKAVITSPVAVCVGRSAVLSAGGGVDFRWYSDSVSVAVVANGAVFETPVVTGNRQWWVSAVSAEGCVGNRQAVQVLAAQLSPPVLVSGDKVCKGGNIALIARANRGTVHWQAGNSSVRGDTLWLYNVLEDTPIVFYADDGVCSSSIDTIRVRVRELAEPVVRVPAVVSLFTPFVFGCDSVGGVSYEWFLGEGGQPSRVSGAGAHWGAFVSVGKQTVELTTQAGDCRRQWYYPVEVKDKLSDIDDSLVNSTDIFRVYPNPANGSVTLLFTGDNWQGDWQPEIYDAGGKLVFSQRLESRGYEVRGLAAGVYWVRCANQQLRLVVN